MALFFASYLLTLQLAMSQTNPLIEYEPENIDGAVLANTGAGGSTYDLDLSSALASNLASIEDVDAQCKELCFTDAEETCVKVPLDIDTAAIPNLSFEVLLKQRAYHEHLAWIMSNDDGAFDRSIIMEDSRYGSGNKLALGVGGTYTSVTNSLALNEYRHLVAVWQGGAGGTASLYLDGVLQQTTAIQRNSVSNLNYFCLNDNAGHANHAWNGCMNVVRVYDSALTAAEVSSLHQQAVEKLTSCSCSDEDCDDGDICNGAEFCADGQCTSGDDVECPANFLCSSERQQCVRDCETFAIDGYLRDCSEEFDYVKTDVAGVSSQASDNQEGLAALEPLVSANTGNLASATANVEEINAVIGGERTGWVESDSILDQLTALNARLVDIDSLLARMNAVEASLDAIEERLFGFAPQTGEGENSENSFTSPAETASTPLVTINGYEVHWTGVFTMLTVVLLAWFVYNLNSCCRRRRKEYRAVYVDSCDDQEAGLKQ
eukprot:CAMPEP_0202690976 /NCGR_PEP_ID=MMETSP1385-20130828/5825_1 /ASSEMBLY_ACC=CAM_ASM_000861 /TAXON_ID=933848 /ORGANISM="Elphidium margaritaceum" /LENGTH=490 /DNA_ID=CAMNT_0049346317 /DNA_START=102 /DNA_END=1574 /DNA_ORIENTATION=-